MRAIRLNKPTRADVLEARRSLEVLGPSLLPRTRGQCAGGPRPCPMVSCRHNLYLDVLSTGSVKPNHEVEPWEVEESCALDVADRGWHTMEEIADMLGVTRERVRQIAERATQKLRRNGETLRRLRECWRDE